MPDKKFTVNLRTVAAHVGLAPCSVSAILNNTPASQAIPQTTKDRVLRAAAELNYRPNLWARSLRTKRTRMVGLIAPDFGRSAIAKVIAGAQARLHQRGYLLALTSIEEGEALQTSSHLHQRGIEGLIAVDADVSRAIDLPVATVKLDYVISSEMGMQDTTAWLAALGETAAETLIRQVENENISRRMKVDPKIPAAFFDIPAAGLSNRSETHETA